MPIKNIDQSSFINFFPEIVDDNNLKILDIWNSFRIKVIPDVYESDAYIEYTPVTTDSLYMLAYRYYGNPKMWWAIPLVNDAEDPFDFIKNVVDRSGTIKILKSNYISGILFNVARLKNAKDKS